MKYNVVDDDYICIKEASFRINHCVIRVSSIFSFSYFPISLETIKKAAQGMVSLSRSIFKKCGPQENHSIINGSEAWKNSNQQSVAVLRYYTMST